jgi:hypothetical protein
MPEVDEDLVGKVCVCSVGRPAIVTGKGTLNGVKDDKGNPLPVWTGLGLDGKGTWASTAPCVIAENGQEFHDKLLKRFGGKMSFNG